MGMSMQSTIQLTLAFADRIFDNQFILQQSNI